MLGPAHVSSANISLPQGPQAVSKNATSSVLYMLPRVQQAASSSEQDIVRGAGTG